MTELLLRTHFRSLIAASIASVFALPLCAQAQEVGHAQEIVQAQQIQEKKSSEPVPKNEERRRPQGKSTTEKTPQRPDSGAVQQVQIQGAKQTETELRRNSIAGKIIIGREELDRDGDTSVGEILKRLPGVTVGGRAGRGGDVRMRGMGGGYTQMLVNGERPPRGFSMESLSPDQVERIEIMRGPVAEFSTQAIAGTINIVLREDFQAKDTDLKLSMGIEQGRVAPNLSISHPGLWGQMQYSLSGSVFKNGQQDRSESHKTELHEDAGLTVIQDQFDQTERHSSGIHLTPRLSYQFENGDRLNFQPFLMHSRSASRHTTTMTQSPELPDSITGQRPFAYASARSHADANSGKLNLNYQHKFEDTSKLTLRIGGGLGRSHSDSERQQFARSGEVLNLLSDLNRTEDSSFSTGGKYLRPVGEHQNFALGWELERGQRHQNRISLDNGVPQFSDSGDNLDAGTRRFAAFVQDEIDISAQWSGYVGLRWEGINTYSSKTNYVVNNQSRVLSPIVHAVYRIPGGGRDQIRMSLTSSYRAPNLNDIIAVPTTSPYNGPTRPDRSGNSDLKPELARGVDLAFEHYFSSVGIVSVNFFAKKIEDLIRRRTELLRIGDKSRWVNAPLNVGQAHASGIELEAKFPLRELFAYAPALDFRGNFSRFWSRVDGIQGANNRLDQQPTMTANIGLDYRPQGAAIQFGGNFNWTPSFENQSSDSQTSFTGIKRQLDAYVLWKLNSQTKLRLAASNLLANDAVSANSLELNRVVYLQSNRAQTYRVLNLRLEMRW